MKNIAVFVKNLTSGGAEKQSVLLANHLVGEYGVFYIVFNGDKTELKYKNMLSSQVHYVEFQGSFIKKFFALCKVLKENSIYALFSYLTAANLLAVCGGKISGVTRIFPGIRNAELPFLKLLSDRFVTNTFKVTSIVNCFSGKNNFVNKGFSENRLAVIHNCIDISSYKINFQKKNDIIQVITVGRFVEQKDYYTALVAIALLISEGRCINYIIIGYGELEQQIITWIDLLGLKDYVQVLINPNDIFNRLCKADIYLSTSLFEGTSNSIMEAMDACLPVVATDVGDNSYLVKQDTNGFLVETGDSKEIAAKLSVLIDDPLMRNTFGSVSKEILRNNFSPEVFKKKYKFLIEN